MALLDDIKGASRHDAGSRSSGLHLNGWLHVFAFKK
jgi:hypothetical protein